ncbi:hypothetical protein A2U01_0066803, partial [Trifolium medium]|nr:hypothetical protein [Trifolium medium]
HNLFTGYSVGEVAPVSVLHLQFTDDTLLMGIKSWANVRALRAALARRRPLCAVEWERFLSFIWVSYWG